MNSTPAERIIRSMVATVDVPSSLWWRSSRVALWKPHAVAIASKNEDFPALFSPTRNVAPDSRGIRTSTIFLKFDTWTSLIMRSALGDACVCGGASLGGTSVISDWSSPAFGTSYAACSEGHVPQMLVCQHSPHWESKDSRGRFRAIVAS